jgi:hypothetical protein
LRAHEMTKIRFRFTRREEPLTYKWVLLDLLAQAIAIVLFTIGTAYSFMLASVFPFIASVCAAGLVFWACESLRKMALASAEKRAVHDK